MPAKELFVRSLNIRNVLRVHAVNLKMERDSAVVIEGGNEQGKSSCLAALEIALGGMSAVPPDPIREGAEQGSIIATLAPRDDSEEGTLVISKVFRPSRKPALKVTLDGKRQGRQQTTLDALLNRVALDPLKFMRMPDQEQRDILAALCGFDTAEIDARRQDLYDKRRDQNRVVAALNAQLKGSPGNPAGPTDEVTAGELVDELSAIQAHNAEIREAGGRVKEREAAVTHYMSKVARQDATIKGHITTRNELREQLAELQKRIDAYGVTIADARAEKDAAESALATATADYTAAVTAFADMEIQDDTPVRARLAEIDATNKAARDNAAAAKIATQLKAATGKVTVLQAELDACGEERAAIVAEAADKLPIPDLSLSDNAVLYKGKPLSQAGKSAQLRLSVAVAIALNEDATVKFLAVDDAESLDHEHMTALLRQANEAGFQVLGARVLPEAGLSDGALLIEDGELVEE